MVAVGGAFTVVVGLFGLLRYLNGGVGLAGPVPATPLGWMLPPVAALLIGGVSWMLAHRAPRYRDEPPTASVPCARCGKPIMDAWRLCPYCGSANVRDPEPGANA